MTVPDVSEEDIEKAKRVYEDEDYYTNEDLRREISQQLDFLTSFDTGLGERDREGAYDKEELAHLNSVLHALDSRMTYYRIKSAKLERLRYKYNHCTVVGNIKRFLGWVL